MAKYTVKLQARARVIGYVTVEADSIKEADKAALKLADAGDIVWTYDGTGIDGKRQVAWAERRFSNPQPTK